VSVSCTSPDGDTCGDSGQAEDPFDGTYDTPSADLTDFIGSGALTVDLNYSNSPACEPSSEFICALDFELAWTSGTVELKYSYRAVPEPSTWVMMALGLAGLGGTGLRRRKPAAALA
jgi:PEP-CTERM motif